MCVFSMWTFLRGHVSYCEPPSIVTVSYQGTKRGCHPCFPGKTAAAGSAQMDGLLLEIRSW